MNKFTDFIYCMVIFWTKKSVSMEMHERDSLYLRTVTVISAHGLLNVAEYKDSAAMAYTYSLCT